MRTVLAILFILQGSFVWAQEYQTFTYAEGDTFQLGLDVFIPDHFEGPRPLFIYVHGGGFGMGDRMDGMALCDTFSQHGIVAATISYRLYMKNRAFGCPTECSEKIRAIQIAVNDLWAATDFLLDRAEEFNIDPTRVFIGGSSAGAETVLHAAYWPVESMRIQDAVPDSAFRYAGIVSGAGALMDLNLIKPSTLIPTMLFHGTCDPLVPYGTASHHFCPCDSPGWLMFFGAQPIFERMEELGGTTELYTYRGEGHRIAGYPFDFCKEEMIEFIYQAGQSHPWQKHTIIDNGNHGCEEGYFVRIFAE